MDFLVHHLLRAAAARSPDEEALVHRTERLTFRELDERVSALAEGLRRAGCARGDRIGVHLRPSVAQVLSILAVSRAGGVFVPIHHSLFPEQLGHIVGNCAMRGLIAGSALADRARAVVDESCLELVVIDGEPTQGELRPRTLGLDELLDTQVDGNVPDRGIDRDLAAILYTSGSTGKPKGIMLSHANVMAGASIVSDYLRIDEHDRILAALPFSFDAGLNQLTTALQQRATLVLLDFFLANEIPPLLLKENITGLAGVPTLWNLIAGSRTFEGKEFPRLRYITNTGGVLPQTVLGKLRTTLPGTDIVLMYGLTEAFRSTYLPPDELDRRPTSMGKAIPNTEILVVDEDGRACAPGEIGELVHHGPTVSLGYWGEPELNRKVFRPHPWPEAAPGSPTVCYSGDLVRQDEDGYLYFVGRRDRQLKSSGFRISPDEVEDVLLRSGVVRQAAVIGVPDELKGQSIVAFVVSSSDTPVDPDELRAFCGTNMPAYMVPERFEPLPSLPTLSNGKVDYEALRDVERSRA